MGTDLSNARRALELTETALEMLEKARDLMWCEVSGVPTFEEVGVFRRQCIRAISRLEDEAFKRWNKGISKKQDAVCPSCGAKLDYFPDQDGSCLWECPQCGWHVAEPPNSLLKP